MMEIDIVIGMEIKKHTCILFGAFCVGTRVWPDISQDHEDVAAHERTRSTAS